MPHNKPILVTGGCGFVGRHLIKKLLAEGESLWIVDNLSTGIDPKHWLPPEWEEATPQKTSAPRAFHKGSQTLLFLETNALTFFEDQIAKKTSVAIPHFSDVYHLASIVGGRSLIDGDPLLVAYDLAIDALFFAWVTRFPEHVERVLYASSSAAYPTTLQGEEGAIALKEKYIDFSSGTLGQPDMTYGWSKLSGEYLARLAHERYGVHTACVRPFSGYGEDQDLSYPTPAIALRVARHENPIEVWGTGEQARDFVHIDDCVDAMRLILERVNDGRGINIGSGTLTSFNTLISTLCHLEGHHAEIRRLLDKPVGVTTRYADTHVLSNEIGWQPQISLEEGLRRVLTGAHERIEEEAHTK